MAVRTDHHLDEAAAAVAAYLSNTASSSDPYRAYRALRELAPVHWSEALGYWVVTGHAAAEACYRDNRFSRFEAGRRQWEWVARDDDPDDIKLAVRTWASTVLNFDPPDHTRLRVPISRAFTPRAVSGWKERTEAIVAGIIDRVRGLDTFDLLTHVAYPVPETVICEILGVPVEDHDRWKQWSQGMNRAAILNGRNRASDDLPAEVRSLAQQSLLQWYAYLTDLVARRSGGTGEDLVSVLVRSSEAGEGLSDLEVVGTIGLLIGAGHDTTANLIANGMLALMRNPEQYELLRADPSLAGAVVEETLRYDGSARGQPRVALEDVELCGRTISAGDTVMVIANAANRDPEKFTDPERFDITRRESGHVAFAAGIHFCVGAPLARMEAEVAFRRLAELPRRFVLATEELSYKPTHGRNLTSLPVVAR